MILTHTTAYFLSIKSVYRLWDIIHFVVPIFVFCSSYIYYHQPAADLSGFFPFFKKRVIRLLVPYYVFLLFYFLLVFFFEPKKINLDIIIRNLTLTGGVDINWLVVLFIYFVILTPFVYAVKKKLPVLFAVFSMASLASGFIFLNHYPPFDYRLIMWLPWSTIIIFSYYLADWEKNGCSPSKSIIPAGLFFICFWFLIKQTGHSMIFQNNKYPPNLYYLSYGIFWTSLLYFFHKKFLYQLGLVNKIFGFFSRHSYSLFFIHYIVIYFIFHTPVYRRLDWIGFTIVVLFLSVILQLILSVLTALYSSFRLGKKLFPQTQI